MYIDMDDNFVSHVWQIGGYFFPSFIYIIYICLLCDKICMPWNLGAPGFDVWAP